MASRCSFRFYKDFKALQVHDTSLIRCHIFYNHQYIYFRLQKAGATKSLFSKEALEFIYQASEGIPRRINSICDLCLLDASNAQIALINSAIAKKVIQEV